MARRAVWAAEGWAVAFVAAHGYWALGGRLGFGDQPAGIPPTTSSLAGWVFTIAVAAMFIAGFCGVPLALVQRWGWRIPRRLLLGLMWAGALFLTARGGLGLLDDLLRQLGVDGGLTGLSYLPTDLGNRTANGIHAVVLRCHRSRLRVGGRVVRTCFPLVVWCPPQRGTVLRRPDRRRRGRDRHRVSHGSPTQERQRTGRTAATAASTTARGRASAFDLLIIGAWVALLSAAAAVLRLWVPGGVFPSAPPAVDLSAFAATVLPAWIYLTVSESGSGRASWGRRRVGLRVVAQGDNGKTGAPRIAGRNAVKLMPWQLAHLAVARLILGVDAPVFIAVTYTLSLALSAVSILMAWRDRQHRALHDRVAGTRVVQTGADPGSCSRVPPQGARPSEGARRADPPRCS